MSKYNLGFISDKDIKSLVKVVIKAYNTSMDLKKFNENIIDPIKLTFDMKAYSKTIEQTIKDEIARQIDKTCNNQIGYFHQNIFAYMDGDWYVPKKGFDIANDNKKIYVELKNKHNTMNASASQKTYINMQSKLLQYTDSKCFLVEVIARKSQNIVWQVTVDGQQHFNKRIRRISIDKFYQIVTGDIDAFKKLCTQLPIIIDDVLEKIKEEYRDNPTSQNTVLNELQQINPNIMKSIYLMAFETYNGFDCFDITV